LRLVHTLTALLFCIVACVANAEQLSDADLKNLLARIREHPVTRADFQEQRVIRLMKKPIVNSGRVWFQAPNKFRREVKGDSPSGEANSRSRTRSAASSRELA